MATTKPRITVTLDPDDYAVIRALSDMNGESMSSILAGLATATRPVLEKVVAAGRAFEVLSAQRQEAARELLADADAQITPELEALQSDVLRLMESFNGALESVQDPRPVTRGSRPPLPTPPLADGRTREEAVR